ncbi:MAG: tetratricopeptide repeat protein [Deltaproteobacteria bacterium]|nr:tetratricopeptide repeat protein [Deltaproteobacteria bacterium]
MVTIRGYHIPDDIRPGGPLAQWIAGYEDGALALMDAGDIRAGRGAECLPQEGFDQPGDRRLGKVELFQFLTGVEYQQATMLAVQHGYAGHWKTWETLMQQKDYLASLVRELGFEPSFHIANRDYHRRIIELLQAVPLNGGIPHTVEMLYAMALPTWEAGGLCLAYLPFGDPLRAENRSADEAVDSCMAVDGSQWATCTQTAVKALTLVMSAYELFDWAFVAGMRVYPFWVTVDRLRVGPAEAAHAYIEVSIKDGQAERKFALDPSMLDPNVLATGRRLRALHWHGAVATAHRNRAIYAAARGDWRAASHHFALALMMAPDDPGSYNGFGVASAAEGATRAAMAMFMQALCFDPKDSHARFNLGKALAENEQDYAHAIEQFQRVVKAEPGHVKARMEMGNAHRELQQYREAEAAYRQALTIEPQYVNAYVNLCGVLATQGRFDEAGMMCDTALAIDPRHPLAHFNKGALLLKWGRDDEARKALDLAGQLDPTLKGDVQRRLRPGQEWEEQLRRQLRK